MERLRQQGNTVETLRLERGRAAAGKGLKTGFCAR